MTKPIRENIYWEFPGGTLPTELIDLTIKRSEDKKRIEGEIASEETKDKAVRSVTMVHLDEFDPICLTLYGLTNKANDSVWKYVLSGPSQFELLFYKEGDHYDGHQDTMYFDNGMCRKLSVVALLNDEFEGGKFYIQYDFHKDNRLYIDMKKGSVVVFPPYTLHGVEPVTSGNRISMTGWLTGPNFK